MSRWPKGATEQYGVMHHDGSVSVGWNGRTARQRAEEAAAWWRAQVRAARHLRGATGEPIDRFDVVVRYGPDRPWVRAP